MLTEKLILSVISEDETLMVNTRAVIRSEQQKSWFPTCDFIYYMQMLQIRPSPTLTGAKC